MPAMPRRGVWSTSSTPFLLERFEVGVDVGRLEADVVQALAFALEEAADGGVGTGGFEKLDLALADGQKSGLNALVFDSVLGVDVEAEGVAVELEGLVEGVDSDADVVDFLDHLFSNTNVVLRSSYENLRMSGTCVARYHSPLAGR